MKDRWLLIPRTLAQGGGREGGNNVLVASVLDKS